ncbi:MAG: hypothetical protein QNJ94_13040 [Alphaproteobacteria bacterium]|nr:hypothetical protein [Alphaproteobacteria bacterium]
MELHFVAGILAFAMALAVVLPASAGEKRNASPEPDLSGLSPQAIEAAVREVMNANPAAQAVQTSDPLPLSAPQDGRVVLEVELRDDGSLGQFRIKQRADLKTDEDELDAEDWRLAPMGHEPRPAGSFIQVPMSLGLAD